MRRLPSPPVRLGARLAAAGLACVLPLAPALGAPEAPGPVAQKQQPAARLDPALRDAAEQKAGAYVLSSADGDRKCPITLKAEAAGAGLAVQFDKAACAATIGFSVQISGWLPDASGALRLLTAQGRTVAEFTEATGGSYEALREGDGVYFLINPSIVDVPEVTQAEVVGDWDLATSPGTPLCRWSLTQTPAPKGGFALQVAPGCAPAVARLGAAVWRLDGGNILVSGASGGPAIRFARQEDGSWARVPERGRPLLLSRP
ncbi:AprI/Inh family metalloprotease inhibitor [Xanthobacter sp. KR7-225]|uniref:protease inhibitor Inh/omp19 family protein n=1 Tax=Xanthobacter sp. KR7-225 TaxID=3156613 RepID=UPI0032B52C13